MQLANILFLETSKTKGFTPNSNNTEKEDLHSII